MAGTTWVATFDGGEARILRKDPKTGYLHEIKSEAISAAHATTPEGSTTTPYRLSGEPRAFAEPALPPEVLTEVDFVRLVTERLTQKAEAGEFDRLIVAAAPDALGVFRRGAPEALKAKVAVEIAKDHVHTPVKKLEQVLAEEL